MLIKYCLFCLGGGLIQQSAIDSYGGKDMLYMPLWMSSKLGRLFTLLISICILIAEIYIGIILFNVWIGMSFWLIALIITTFIVNEFKQSNPMVILVLGILVIIVSLLLLYKNNIGLI